MLTLVIIFIIIVIIILSYLVIRNIGSRFSQRDIYNRPVKLYVDTSLNTVTATLAPQNITTNNLIATLTSDNNLPNQYLIINNTNINTVTIVYNNKLLEMQIISNKYIGVFSTQGSEFEISKINTSYTFKYKDLYLSTGTVNNIKILTLNATPTVFNIL